MAAQDCCDPVASPARVRPARRGNDGRATHAIRFALLRAWAPPCGAVWQLGTQIQDRGPGPARVLTATWAGRDGGDGEEVPCPCRTPQGTAALLAATPRMAFRRLRRAADQGGERRSGPGGAGCGPRTLTLPRTTLLIGRSGAGPCSAPPRLRWSGTRSGVSRRRWKRASETSRRRRPRRSSASGPGPLRRGGSRPFPHPAGRRRDRPPPPGQAASDA